MRYHWSEDGSMRFGIVTRREGGGYIWILRFDGFALSGQTETEDAAMEALTTAIKARRLYRRPASAH